jgi:hypothetical protein
MSTMELAKLSVEPAPVSRDSAPGISQDGAASVQSIVDGSGLEISEIVGAHPSAQ